MLRTQPLLRDDDIFIGDLIPYTSGRLDIGWPTLHFRTIYVDSIAPAVGNWVLTLPTTDGTPGQVLITDGSGVTSWATVSAGDAAIGGTVTGGTAGMVLFNSDTNKLNVYTTVWEVVTSL